MPSLPVDDLVQPSPQGLAPFAVGGDLVERRRSATPTAAPARRGPPATLADALFGQSLWGLIRRRRSWSSSRVAAGLTRRCRASARRRRVAPPATTPPGWRRTWPFIEASLSPQPLDQFRARLVTSFCTPVKYRTCPSAASTGERYSSLRNSVPSFLKLRSSQADERARRGSPPAVAARLSVVPLLDPHPVAVVAGTGSPGRGFPPARTR